MTAHGRLSTKISCVGQLMPYARLPDNGNNFFFFLISQPKQMLWVLLLLPLSAGPSLEHYRTEYLQGASEMWLKTGKSDLKTDKNIPQLYLVVTGQPSLKGLQGWRCDDTLVAGSKGVSPMERRSTDRRRFYRMVVGGAWSSLVY